jgi:hypothetical protein
VVGVVIVALVAGVLAGWSVTLRKQPVPPLMVGTAQATVTQPTDAAVAEDRQEGRPSSPAPIPSSPATRASTTATTPLQNAAAGRPDPTLVEKATGYFLDYARYGCQFDDYNARAAQASENADGYMAKQQYELANLERKIQGNHLTVAASAQGMLKMYTRELKKFPDAVRKAALDTALADPKTPERWRLYLQENLPLELR